MPDDPRYDDPNIPPWMRHHMQDDFEFQHTLLTKTLPGLATKEDIAKLSNSVGELITLQRNINTTVNISSRFGRWLYRTAVALSPFLVAVTVFVTFWNTVIKPLTGVK